MWTNFHRTIVAEYFTFQGVSIMQAQALVDYIYCGEVTATKEELVEFIQLAKGLQLKGVLEYTGSLSTMDKENNGEKSISIEY